jgi:hypothetical protein
MSPEFRDAYVQARDATRTLKDRYSQGNIPAILDKKYGGTYGLNGDEITNKLWHGGMGLQQDVVNLKNTLSQENQLPALDALRKYVMTEAAGKTTAAGNLASAMPAYVENRMPALRELMTPEQYTALTNTAKDIKNAAGAQAVQGLIGSPTYANIAKALDAGVLDSATAKGLAKALSLKIGGGETIRQGLANSVMKGKGSTMADLLADPQLLNKAVADAMKKQPNKLAELLQSPQGQQLLYRLAPQAATSRQ